MDIEKEIAAIHERNMRVAADKAWEVSWTRRLFILVTTYLGAVMLLYVIGTKQPYFGAMVPTAGYLLSTVSLPFVRRLWDK